MKLFYKFRGASTCSDIVKHNITLSLNPVFLFIVRMCKSDSLYGFKYKSVSGLSVFRVILTSFWQLLIDSKYCV